MPSGFHSFFIAVSEFLAYFHYTLYYKRQTKWTFRHTTEKRQLSVLIYSYGKVIICSASEIRIQI